MRTLSDGLIHSDVAKLNVNNLSGMKLLEGNYDCYLQSQRPNCYLTSFPGRTTHTAMCALISTQNLSDICQQKTVNNQTPKKKKERKEKAFIGLWEKNTTLLKNAPGSLGFSILLPASGGLSIFQTSTNQLQQMIAKGT